MIAKRGRKDNTHARFTFALYRKRESCIESCSGETAISPKIIVAKVCINFLTRLRYFFVSSRHENPYTRNVAFRGQDFISSLRVENFKRENLQLIIIVMWRKIATRSKCKSTRPGPCCNAIPKSNQLSRTHNQGFESFQNDLKLHLESRLQFTVASRNNGQTVGFDSTDRSGISLQKPLPCLTIIKFLISNFVKNRKYSSRTFARYREN